MSLGVDRKPDLGRLDDLNYIILGLRLWPVVFSQPKVEKYDVYVYMRNKGL